MNSAVTEQVVGSILQPGSGRELRVELDELRNMRDVSGPDGFPERPLLVHEFNGVGVEGMGRGRGPPLLMSLGSRMGLFIGAVGGLLYPSIETVGPVNEPLLDELLLLHFDALDRPVDFSEVWEADINHNIPSESNEVMTAKRT